MEHNGALLDSLQHEIDELRREVERLNELREQLMEEPEDGNVYVFEEDAEEARAFDEFYRAYDEVHAKTRKFLLG